MEKVATETELKQALKHRQLRKEPDFFEAIRVSSIIAKLTSQIIEEKDSGNGQIVLVEWDARYASEPTWTLRKNCTVQLVAEWESHKSSGRLNGSESIYCSDGIMASTCISLTAQPSLK